ncbi:DUF4142 domain-containing protein, partial [Cronobacter sakazakii]|uniref:DUF4142 domain-containing protein n=1 Tax=Cronobacter sakazakii TaxID=28141 RepID=UPI000D500DD8
MQKTKTLKGLLVASAVAAMFSTAGVQAETPESTTQNEAAGQTTSGAKLSAGDKKALKDMAQADINEVAAAKIALEKAQNSDVKAFAQKMVDDHSAALSKVQAVAQQKSGAPPAGPGAKHKAMAAKLEKEGGGALCKQDMENAGAKKHKNVASKQRRERTKRKEEK